MAKLLGNRIYLEMPKKEESKLIVDENTKESLEKEMLKKMNKLKIHTVGTANMDEELVVGAFVLVDPSALSKAPLIPLSEEENVLLVSPFDIIQIW
jgi:hypothetical protein|tara:strand:+ start:2386 stop:2673 length:288 start_codon:yes stop_codon:yes gene_type:complete